VTTHIQVLTVYNFEVAEDHSYLAGGIAVHNCVACWVMHDTEHPNDEPGPNDHQQGRCIASPITKTWRELGYDIDEPPSLVRDARATFMGLSEEQQLAIMGPQRLELFLSGRVAWSDLATVRQTEGWRDSIVPTPVRRLAA
jgi:hypothetical protein